jgi:hypothetical protein
MKKQHHDHNIAIEGLEALSREAPLPDPSRQAAIRQQFLAEARQIRRQAVSGRMVMRPNTKRQFLFGRGRLQMSTVGKILLALTLFGSSVTGTAFAADASAPGETLYSVDQAMEQVQTALATSPQAQARLFLSLASERAGEVGKLAEKGDLENVGTAMQLYSTQVALLADLDGVDDALLDEALVEQEEQLDEAFDYMVGDRDQLKTQDQDRDQDRDRIDVCGTGSVDDGTDTGEDADDGAIVDDTGEDVGDDTGDDTGDTTTVVTTHPAAQKIADTYDVSYEQVMSWFCDGGYGFGEIMLALSASEEMGMSVDELLAMKAEGTGWGSIWKEIGLFRGHGQDEDFVPPGQENKEDMGQGQGQGQGQGNDEDFVPPGQENKENGQGQGQGSQSDDDDEDDTPGNGQGQGSGDCSQDGTGDGVCDQPGDGQGQDGNQGRGNDDDFVPPGQQNNDDDDTTQGQGQGAQNGDGDGICDGSGDSDGDGICDGTGTGNDGSPGQGSDSSNGNRNGKNK